jgi:hypothetical protein
MACNYQGKIVTNGLVLCLDAADKKSYPGTGTVWRDRSGNAYNGNLIGSPSFDSANGGSIVFDGTDDYVDLTSLDSSLFDTEATLIVWLKLDLNQPDNSDSGIFGFTTNTTYYSHYTYSGLGYFDTFRSTRINTISLSSLDKSTPHMLCITTKGGGSWKLYQNTNVVFTTAAQSTVSMGNKYLGVKNASDLSFLFKGKFYAFSLYNKELSSAEIQQNFNATRGRFGI